MEAELIPMAQEMGIGVVPWSPLRNGFLSGKFRRDNVGSVDSPRSTLTGLPSESDFVVIDTLIEVAREVGASPAAVALAWVRSRPGVTSTLIGARRMEQLVDNLAALDVKLLPEHIAKLDSISQPPVTFPDKYLQSAASMAFPGTTIDGVTTPLSRALAESATRY